MNSTRARAALVLLNLGLTGAIAYLVDHAIRRGAPTEIPPGPPPVAYAYDPGDRPPRLDASGEIGLELDRPLPVEERTSVDPAPPPVIPPLEARFRLLLVCENEADPTRSSAIVSTSSGQQRTLTLGEMLDGAYQVVGLAVQGEGDARRALMIVERPAAAGEPGDRQVLRTARTTP